MKRTAKLFMKKKCLNILLGSGIHSGFLDSVGDLTKLILDYSPEYIGLNEQLDNNIINFRKFINIIHNEIKVFFKGYLIKPTYEDIIYLLLQFKEHNDGFKFNPAFDYFYKNVLIQYGFSELDINKKNIYSEVNKAFFSSSHHSNLLEAIYRFISERLNISSAKQNGIIKNIDPLTILTKSIYQIDSSELNIFSLNHDTAFEDSFIQNNIKYNDGFSSGISCNPNSYTNGIKFDIKSFNSYSNINLLKLHGSINWFYNNYNRELINIDAPIELFEPYIYKLTNGVSYPYDDLAIIAGIYNKLELYTTSSFFDLFCLFKQKLYNSNHLVISGYGFMDKGINNFISEWLLKDADNKILLIHPDINQLTNKSIKNITLKETFIYRNYQTFLDKNKLFVLDSKFSGLKTDSVFKSANKEIQLNDVININN